MKRIYESPLALADALGMAYEVTDGHGVDGFPSESDWGVYRARGLDAPPHGGWLVAFANNGRGFTTTPGYLVAYEVIGEGKDGRGRALLLSGQISPADDEVLLDRARRQSWWNARDGQMDIETLADWLDDQPEVARSPVP
jgi:hypothetical protein